MEWTEVILKIASNDLDTASAITTAVSPGGLYIEDYSDMLSVLPSVARYDYIADTLLEKDTRCSTIHFYLPSERQLDETVKFLKERLQAEKIEYELSTKSVLESDWAENWKQYYHTRKIGERLVVRPSWENYAPIENEVVVVLDPGMSFGTGEHETTHLCLELLEKTIRGGERVLDAGAGSGILSIASIKLGASSVTAVDIDKTAVEIAKKNARENGIPRGQGTMLCGDLLDTEFAKTVGGRYDILVANIVADVIIPAAPVFFEKMNRGAVLIVSGIIEWRAGDVKNALKQAGFRKLEVFTENDWTAIMAKKRNNRNNSAQFVCFP